MTNSDTTMPQAYDAEFFAAQREGSLRSARLIVPQLLQLFPATSVVDVGCGIGTWLRACVETGVAEAHGYDGDYVDRPMLEIAPEAFTAVDLRDDFPLRRRHYDLALSLEVAEHLPPEAARGFVRRLTEAAPIVAFSAAIPGQGGTEHLNECWQDEWRAVFAAFDYRPVDCIRPAIWGNAMIEYWYQQNLVVYCSRATLAARPDLLPVADAISLNLVHPILYGFSRRATAATAVVEPIATPEPPPEPESPPEPAFLPTLRRLPGLFARAVGRRLGG